MVDEWVISSIQAVTEKVAMGPFGSSIRVETFVPEGVPVISGQHLRGVRLNDLGYNFITPEHADKLSNANVRRGDVVFTHAGNIGQVAYIPNSSEYSRYVISQRQFYLRPNTEKALPEFIAYFFTSADGQHLLLANASSSGVPSIAQPVSYLRTIEIPVPPLPEQRAIVHILGTLDDKIELNRRMNETLEAVARALFKSWFVDFDPVRAKAEGRAPWLPNHLADMFPSSFEDSEVGEIPKGWMVCVLDQLAEDVLGGDWGGDEQDADRPAAAHCIRGADIPDLQSGGTGRMPIRYLTAASLAKRRLHDGDLVVEISGGSPTQSTGRPVLVSQALLGRLHLPLVCSNFCRLLRLKPHVSSKFVYLWLRALYANDVFLQFENGTTGIKNFAYTLFSSSFKFCVPPPDIMREFDACVAALFVRQQVAAMEADTLASLREALLPKLISGELRVPDTMRIAGRTCA